ncbi:MAG: hypothetical protein FJY99_09295 [Candidatus Sericytochromatia bacterium]|nr:hypothetical protein [Candidatus Tanganyikabacteria bacterium]
MGGVANVISGISQGMQGRGGIFDAIGKFVPEMQQMGGLFQQLGGAFDAFSQMSAQQDQGRIAGAQMPQAPGAFQSQFA